MLSIEETSSVCIFSFVVLFSLIFVFWVLFYYVFFGVLCFAFCFVLFVFIKYYFTLVFLSRLFNQLHHLFNMSISFVINIFVYSCGFDDTHQLVLRDYIFSRNYKIYLMARFTNSPMFLFLLNPIVRFFLNFVPIVGSFLIRCQYFLIIL